MDATFRESILIEYQTEPVNGIPTNQLHVRYSGRDSTLTRPRELTLAEVQPMIEAWKVAPVDPQPPDLPNVEGPNLFLLL